MRRFTVTGGRSTILVAARSSMGPIVFESNAVIGELDVAVTDDTVGTEPAPTAQIRIDLTALRSGNDVYDAELRRRLETSQYPRCTLDLEQASPTAGERFSLHGTVTFHGVTRPIDGTVDVEGTADGRLVVTGEKVLDIRDFDIPPPGILMLKIYPEVEVRMFIEAVPENDGSDR